MSKYCKEYYGVPSDINRLVTYKGEQGIIYKDGGTYVSVNLDKDKPASCVNIHPTDENLIYLDLFGTPRKLTRSQKRYHDYLDGPYYDAGDGFAVFLGIT